MTAQSTQHPTASLAQYIYVSSAQRLMDSCELGELLCLARERNHVAGITGMLVYCEGGFLQVLEGEASRVDELYRKIGKDSRHTHMVGLIQSPIENRSFSNWSMGFVDASRPELMAIPGCNDFFASGACLSQVDAGRAKLVLERFRESNTRSLANQTRSRERPYPSRSDSSNSSSSPMRVSIRGSSRDSIERESKG